VDANGNEEQHFKTPSVFHYNENLRPESSLMDRIESVQQAPGGYWLSMANNERVWFPLDNKYSSLDRRNLTKKQLGHSAKSTSMGNIDFGDLADTVSVTSISSENKRREKTWQETSLDEENILLPPQTVPASPVKFLHPSDIENANITPPKLVPRGMSQPPPIPDAKLARAPSLEPYRAVKSPDIIERPSSVMITQLIPVSPTASLYSPDNPNITIVQQGKIQPYKEEEKPFEMADFYKYSTKFRQKQPNGGNSKAG